MTTEQPKDFFTHRCHKCGGVDEARLTISGKHIKQTCSHCGFYIKFISPVDLPSIAEIRLKIWAWAKGDVTVIDKAKKEVDFNPQTGYYGIVGWWRVYLKVRSLMPSEYL